MSSSLSSAKTILEADATLLALATGGIYDFDETGRMGINRSNSATSGAFVNGVVQPCLLLKLSVSTPFGEVADDAAKVTGARDVLQVWAYQDNGYATMTSMLDRVFTLLQGQQLGGFVCRWLRKVQPPIRDVDIDANIERDDYEVFWMRS